MLWCGPRLKLDQQSEYMRHLAVLSNFEYMPGFITRMVVNQGHEDDTVLSFFKNGFFCHDGPRPDAGFASHISDTILERGALYRIMGPYGETPQAVEQDLVQASNLNSGESFVVVS